MVFNANFQHFKRTTEQATQINQVEFLRGKNGGPYTDVHGQSGYIISLSNSGRKYEQQRFNQSL